MHSDIVNSNFESYLNDNFTTCKEIPGGYYAINDYGYELSKDASDEEIKECAEDYEMTIKYIRKPN